MRRACVSPRRLPPVARRRRRRRRCSRHHDDSRDRDRGLPTRLSRRPSHPRRGHPRIRVKMPQPPLPSWLSHPRRRPNRERYQTCRFHPHYQPQTHRSTSPVHHDARRYVILIVVIVIVNIVAKVGPCRCQRGTKGSREGRKEPNSPKQSATSVLSSASRFRFEIDDDGDGDNPAHGS